MNIYFSDHDAVKRKIEVKPICGNDEILTLDWFSLLNMSLYYKLIKISLHYQFFLR